MRDLYTLDRPAAYYDNLLVNSPATARYLMKTYAVHAPDDADGHKGSKLREIDNVRTGGAIKVADMFNKKVTWLHLSRSARGQYWKSGNEGGDTLYGTASYTAGSGVPVYWLPWDSAGAIVSLKIPKKGTRARGEPDPDRFFTAAINGCSVFFSGDRDSPTVYHCGGDTSQSGPGAAAKFWRDLVTRMQGSGVQGVDKQDYITTDGVKSTGGMTTTQAAKDYEAWLKKETSGQIEIEDVRPWGCVMGIRDDNGLWTFYLQENASVSYYTLKKKGIFSSKLVREKEKAYSGVGVPKKDKDDRQIVVDRKRTVSRPIHFYEVFPSKERTVRIDQPVPRSMHG
jgi:hypothetical protein